MVSDVQFQQGATSFSIPDLVRLAATGVIRVPSFQRAYVWEAEDVRKLFDSLYRGFPVGTILLWRRDAPEGKASFGPVEIEVESVADALWVVDGQQRITSLFGALVEEFRAEDKRFDVYFDLAGQRFVSGRRGVRPRRAIPVHEALETRTLLNWLRVHADELEADDFDVADRLGAVLRDYKIPAYVVTSDDEDLLREIFDRVNSAGKPIGRAQVFHALFGKDEAPASPAGVVAELSVLGFGDVHQNRVVQSLLAIRGGNISRDVRGEFDPAEDQADWFDLTERALRRAIEFLRQEGVPHAELLPSSFPLPVLAAYFHLHPEPKSWNRRLLSRWLWRGWVHGFGEEAGQTPALRRSVQSVNPAKLEPAKAPSEFDAVKSLLESVPDRDSEPISMARFRTNERNSRLILLALVSLKPLGPDGSEIDVAGSLNEHGVDAITQFVRTRRTDAGARGFWPFDTPISQVRDERILRSHAIDEEAAHHLRSGQAEKFVSLREASLSALVGQFLASRIETGMKTRPPLEDLVVQGEAEEPE